MKALNYSEGSVNAYTKVITNGTGLGLQGLITLSCELECGIFDIVKDEYKNYVPKIDFLQFEDEKALNIYIHQQEIVHKGRTTILRRFPDSIYCGENIDRYNYLTQCATNYEIYTLIAILEFAFSPFSLVTKEEKIQQLDCIINGRNSIKNHIYVMDDRIFSQWSAECELLGDELLIIIAPLHKHAIFVIKSPELVKKMNAIVDNKDNLHFEKRTLKLLHILRNSINDDDGLIEFTLSLQQKKSYFYKPTLAFLSPALKAQVLEKISRVAE